MGINSTTDKHCPMKLRLIDKVEPKCKKSNTDIDAPRRAQLRKLKDDPKWATSSTATDDPKRAHPLSDRDEHS
jgi:hypothetical protein